jgi:hypothetical protein
MRIGNVFAKRHRGIPNYLNSLSGKPDQGTTSERFSTYYQSFLDRCDDFISLEKVLRRAPDGGKCDRFPQKWFFKRLKNLFYVGVFRLFPLVGERLIPHMKAIHKVALNVILFHARAICFGKWSKISTLFRCHTVSTYYASSLFPKADPRDGGMPEKTVDKHVRLWCPKCLPSRWSLGLRGYPWQSDFGRYWTVSDSHSDFLRDIIADASAL